MSSHTLDLDSRPAPHTARMNFVVVALTLLFCGFLYPISVGGISVNYSFAILPLFWTVVFGRLRHPGGVLLLAITIYVSIFFVALMYQVDLVGYSGRRLVSFGLFISAFVFTFIDVNARMTDAFKNALICISLYFSLASVYLLLTSGGSSLGF